MPSKNPDQLVDNLRTHFVPNYSPTTSWGNITSMYLALHGLRAYWPMGGIFYNGTNAHLVDIANRHNVRVMPTATPPQLNCSALTNWVEFDGSEDYAYVDDHADLVRGRVAQAMQISAWYALTTPLGAAVFAAMMITSALRVLSGKGISWKGRIYAPK